MAQVDPDDLKSFWREMQEIRKLQSSDPGQQVSIGFHAKVISRPGANAAAVWYRSSMIQVLNQLAQEKLAPWIKHEEVSDAVLRTMATIPIAWIGHEEREDLPFDVEEFFRRLREDGLQSG